MLIMLGKNFEILFLFSPENRFWHVMQIAWMAKTTVDSRYLELAYLE